MNSLRLDRVNENSPYRILYREGHEGEYYFRTDYAIEFKISITTDYSIIPSGAYTLDIINAGNKPSPGDPKFRLTLVAIIEEFFRQNNDVMLYLTETGNGRQAMRNRLFIRWFNTYEHRDRYVIRAELFQVKAFCRDFSTWLRVVSA